MSESFKLRENNSKGDGYFLPGQYVLLFLLTHLGQTNGYRYSAGSSRPSYRQVQNVNRQWRNQRQNSWNSGSGYRPAYVTRRPAYMTRRPAYVTRRPAYMTRRPAYVTQRPAYVTRTPAYQNRYWWNSFDTTSRPRTQRSSHVRRPQGGNRSYRQYY